MPLSFIAPMALLLGLIAVPILLLYMLRLRRREVQVSSTLLWQQLLRDREANAPWQKLRRNLLMLLQLLILAALVLALMRPYVEVPALTTGRNALLIDASASMNATDVLPSRFEQARRQALDIVSKLGEQDKLAVIRVAEGPEMIENYTSDQERLRGAINSLQPSTAAADWSAALTLAAAGAQGAEKFSIILISDGGIPANVPLRNFGNVQYIKVGQSEANMAITALAAGSDAVNGAQIYARIANYGTASAEIIFSIKLDGSLFNASPYTIPANGSTNVTVSNLPANFHRVEASLTRPASSTVPDYLAQDDTAWTTYAPAAAGRVLIMAKQNRFLEEGFLSQPEWRTFIGDPTRGLPTDKYDLYVFDGWLPSTLPDANMLIVNPPTSTPLFKVGPKTHLTTITKVLPDDLRTRYLKFNDVNVREFETITDTPWADTLVQAEGGPLILAGDAQGRRVALVSFDLYNSDLPLKIAWPILLSNLTEWYKAPRALHVEGNVQPGQTVVIQPLPGSESVHVIRPDGKESGFETKQPLLIYADTSLPGIYTVDLYKGSHVVQEELFAVNLFDANESQIAPRTPPFGTGDIATSSQEEKGQQEYWSWIALLALLILAVEWYFYHRRLQAPRLRLNTTQRFTRHP
jgi:Ca-activated chloride channel homolog